MTKQTDPSVFNKRSFLLSVYLISIAIVLAYLISFIFRDVNEDRRNVMIGFMVLLCAGYLITLKSKTIFIAAHYYSAICFACVSFICSTRGGVAAPGIIWLAMCPLVSFLTISFTAARAWLAVVLVTMMVFYFFDSTYVVAEFDGSKFWNLMAYSLFMIALYFVLRAFRKKVVSRTIELLRVNTLLEEKQSQLEQSQQQLNHQHAEVERARAIEAERSRKLRYYMNQHLEITRMEEIHTGSFQYAVQAIQNFLIKSLDADSTAIWYRREESGELKLIGSLGRYSQNKYEHGTLYKQDFPDAFEMLESGAIVVSPSESPAARQLTALMKHHGGDALSVIGCPFFIEGKFGGFFVCKTSVRTWAEEDIIFIRAISDTLSLAFKSHQRKMHQRLLEEKSREIVEINSSLERKVAERTMALNRINSKLTDIAFTNAHVIRGPICRLVGLKNLLLLSDGKEKEQIVGYMESSIEELDFITRKTSEQLNSITSA